MDARMLTSEEKKQFSRFQIGQVVRHFKRELVENKYYSNDYLYRILNLAKNTETGEVYVVYEALYRNDNELFTTYIRPLKMFCSEVDHDKYHYINQKYRFEPVEIK